VEEDYKKLKNSIQEFLNGNAADVIGGAQLVKSAQGLSDYKAEEKSCLMLHEKLYDYFQSILKTL